MSRIAIVAALVPLPMFAACAAPAGAPVKIAPAPGTTAQEAVPDLPVGAYGGLSVGNAHFGDYEDSPGDDVDADDFAWSLFTGYQFSPFFSVSTGYIDFGELHASGAGGGGFTDDIEYDGIPLLFHGIVPLGDRVGFFTTLGALFWNQDVDYQDGSGPFTADENGTSFAYGGGVNFYVNDAETIGLHVAVTRFLGVGDFEATDHDSDITFASIGVMLHTP